MVYSVTQHITRAFFTVKKTTRLRHTRKFSFVYVRKKKYGPLGAIFTKLHAQKADVLYQISVTPDNERAKDEKRIYDSMQNTAFTAPGLRNSLSVSKLSWTNPVPHFIQFVRNTLETANFHSRPLTKHGFHSIFQGTQISSSALHRQLVHQTT